MAAGKAMSEADVRARLEERAHWALEGGALQRTFVFRDFVQAFGFMTKAAIVAERQNHHPEWSNVYKRVVVRLSTHEAGGITDRDFKLAAAFDGLAGDD